MIPPRFDPMRRCKPCSEWPEADRRGWTRAQSDEEEDSLVTSWAVETRKTRAKAYGRWLTFLEVNEWFDVHSDPGARVVPTRVAKYVDALRAQTASRSVWSMVSNLDAIVRVLAPEQDWTWLRAIANRLKRAACPARAIRPRLVGSARLYHAGFKLMRVADQESFTRPVWQATRFRDGLLLALQSSCALRLKNLTMIALGQHLVKIGDGYTLVFTADEMKNRRPFDTPVPDPIVPYLDVYLARDRLKLLQGHNSNRLWITQYGMPMQPHSIHSRLIKVTRKLFGKSMSSHLFRHDLATSFAIQDPEHIRMASALLHHLSFSTTDRSYILSQQVIASRVYGRLLGELQKGNGRAG